MATPSLSDEDFNRFQTQLIELRTANYELESKLKKTESENVALQGKNAVHEKEITKLQRMSKFPGFQAKSKTRKDMTELMEENDRLTQQMQRYEDDFKLQNQTLLQEVSRLSGENESLQKKIDSLNASGTGNESKQRRLLAENAVLSKTIEGLEKQLSTNDRNKPSENPDGNLYKENSEIETELENIFKDILCMLNEKSTTNNKNTDNGDTQVAEGEKSDADVSDNCKESLVMNYEEIVNDYMGTLKKSLRLRSNSNNVDTDKELQFRLETSRQESEILQKEFNIYKESSKAELQQLCEEVGKWEEKAKRKQESFLKLQEEKELMFEEHRKAAEKLKQDNETNTQKLTQVDELQSKLDVTRAENKSMQSELETLKEKYQENEAVNLKGMEETLKNFKHQNDTLKTNYNTLDASSQEMKITIENLTKENEEYAQKAKQATELAENRKTLLDQTAVERHQEVENQRTKLDGLKSTYELEIQELVTKHNEEIEDLKRQITNSKRLKKELEEAKARVEELSTQVEALHNKSGWLERTLKETEESLEALKKSTVEELEKTKEEFNNEKKTLEIGHLLEIKSHEQSSEKIQKEKEEQETLVGKLTQAAKDREVEYRIANKKTDHLVKDLKRQLNAERKRADQHQAKLQDFIQEIKVKQTYDEIFNPESLQLKTAMAHRRQDSGSHLSLISSVSGADTEDNPKPFKTSSPVESSNSLTGLSDETMDLISRIADLQQEKWKLEERVRHLEENGSAMAEDLMQKSLVIQTYVMDSKSDVSTQRRRSLTLKEKMIDKLKLNNTEELNREMSAKMQLMLEETLARNVQLQKDVDLLSSELQRATTNPT